jgi:type IV pilus assembly protein PilY1
MNRFGFHLLVLAAAGVAVFSTTDARAQQAGTATGNLPNVLLLVDTSGSMERLTNNQLPTCTPGLATTPNRWGILLQALTGNVQAGGAGAVGYSCYSQPRDPLSAYASEYQIAGFPPLDTGYALNYNRPVSGTQGPPDTRCVVAPYKLPGTGAGVGPGNLSEGTGFAEDFPPDALTNLKYSDLIALYPGGTISAAQANACTFLQGNDGQLDLSQDFVRFSLMTFDTDPSPNTGTTTARPAASPWNAAISTAAAPNDPFTGAFSWLRSPGNVATGLLTNPPAGFISRTNTNPASVIPAGIAAGRPTINNATCVQGAANGGAPYPPSGACCLYSPMEVGGRHFAAPPWEGRMVLFPDPNAQLDAIERTNQQIQNVLLSTRPFGATPLDGLMDDARDYLWYSPFGPGASSGPNQDLYVQNGCRQQYVVLLTDGAPNLDMRPLDIAGGAGCRGKDCPYANAYELARSLYKDKGTQQQAVKTFVIGFSVNGTAQYPDVNEGFPNAPANHSCKAFLTDPAFGASGGPTPAAEALTMNNLCFQQTGCPGAYSGVGWKVDTLSGKCMPPRGSTMDACCQLNRIAYEGSAGATPWGTDTPIPPYFADSQTDIVTAFSSILASITQVATTRTVPAQASNVAIPGLPTPIAATYYASFVPDARKPWSGEIVRNRSFCSGGAPTAIGATTGQGDSYANDLANQASNHSRFFITVKGGPLGGTIDSARTIRPFASNADSLQLTAYSGTEIGGVDDTLKTTPNFTDMLQVDDNTCKQSVVLRVNPYPTGTVATPTPMPALQKANCANVVWDFATANANSATIGAFDYNFRCPNATVGTGRCSISGAACTVNLGTTACTASNIPGDTCAPFCTALGAIFRSSPVLTPPPSSFLRDDGYQQFASARRGRRPTMFVSTTDGVLHGLMGLDTGAAGVANQGGAPPNAAPYYEFFAFVPPAVLPKLAANYPTGQQILLDGTAAVKDAIWYRDPTLPSGSVQNDWHTTLVAGFGAAGGGYYALNVSDADCSGNGPAACVAGSGWTAAAPGVTTPAALSAGTGADTSGGRQPGPHFLWQLTDVEQSGAETAKVVRQSPPGAPAQTFVALFGKQTYTPAIATLQMTRGGVPIQVGVAILPGGLDGSPIPTGACTRATSGGYGAFGGGVYNLGPATGLPFSARTQARQWGKTCGAADPVPGRGVTIVRLDTGEIIRHFGRRNTADVPNQVKPLTIDSPFDSPIIGTPVVYPSAIGVPAQKIYVGDADGTIWRIDVSTPCDIGSPNTCDPAAGGGWRASLFQDMIGFNMPTGGATPGKSQPIAIPMVVSPTATGSIVVNAATGEQENIISTLDENFVVSVEDTRPDIGYPNGRSLLHWFEKLPNGERVTGPMTVFDRNLYFATFRPRAVGAICTGTAKQFLWGLDYLQPAGGLLQPPNSGGDCRWVTDPGGNPGPTAHPGCAAGLFAYQEETVRTGGSLIPGVAVQASLGCSISTPSPYSSGLQSVTPTTYSIVAGVSKAGGGVAGAGAAGSGFQIGTRAPRTTATLDAWTLVSD